jgi:predicted nuclease of predicted toxin-antitoxin system
MAHRFHKHKILLDENFPSRLELPRLNGFFDVKHVRDDLKQGGLPDPDVYQLAIKLERVLVTFNAKDFKQLIERMGGYGVIGVSTHLTKEQIDKKLTSLLMHSTPKALEGNFTSLTGET